MEWRKTSKMRIKSYNKTSPGQRAKIETECDLVYFTDGISIGKKLVYNVLGSSVYGLAHNQIGGNKKVFIANADYVRGSFYRIRNYLIFINLLKILLQHHLILMVEVSPANRLL